MKCFICRCIGPSNISFYPWLRWQHTSRSGHPWLRSRGFYSSYRCELWFLRTRTFSSHKLGFEQGEGVSPNFFSSSGSSIFFPFMFHLSNYFSKHLRAKPRWGSFLVYSTFHLTSRPRKLVVGKLPFGQTVQRRRLLSVVRNSLRAAARNRKRSVLKKSRRKRVGKWKTENETEKTENAEICRTMRKYFELRVSSFRCSVLEPA